MVENIENEEWREVVDFPLYEISNLGRLRRGGVVLVMKSNVSTYIGFTATDKYGERRRIYPHQLVANAFLNHINCGHKIVVDHIDNNPKNNRLDNLQLISSRENHSKDKFRKGKTSKYTGVWWCKKQGKWRSAIRIDGKRKYLGSFVEEEDAAQAYQDKLRELGD
tara:strand:+ start:11992 stop:12486 length:495 start_codon:yes stop_codon:yes gene_type:complete